MTKKKTTSVEEEQRKSRKEILLARRHARQTRQIRLAIIAVILLIAIVIVAGVTNTVVIKPNQLAASVGDNEITIRDWRERVQLQRAQLILGIEDLAESLGQDIGQVQQFAGQQLLLLTQDSERLGQLVLDQMIDEILIEQAAQAQGIFISDADVQEEIEASFNYFGGASPTAMPTATETMIPTPSLTPIPTEVITELLPTRTPFPTPTLGPTSTRFPTATPVSEESFMEEFTGVVERLGDLGISEGAFREVVKAQLYQEQFAERLAEEEELPDEAMHASLFYLQFGSEGDAMDTSEEIRQEDFLEIWNKIRSKPFDPDEENPPFAGEILWRTEENVALALDEAVSDIAFDIPLNSASDVIVVPAISDEEQDVYYIIMVSGREVRPLTESALNSARQELLDNWLQDLRANQVEIFERWRANLPTGPRIDPRFLVAPTPTPVIPLETPQETPEEDS